MLKENQPRKKLLLRENQPRKRLPKENQPKENLPRKRLPKENLPRKRLPKENQLKENLPRKRLPKENQLKENLPRKEKNKRNKLVLKDSYLRERFNLQSLVLLILDWHFLESMNKNLVLPLIFIFILLSLGILLFLKIKTNIFDYQFNEKSQSNFLKINDFTLEIEVAKTFNKKAQGLSGRDCILDNQGMFFIFKRPGHYPFWMKGMNFPIDIIWLDKELKIVEISKEIQPESFPKLLRPSVPIQYVLEVESGWADKHNIEQGDKCFFN